MIYLGPDNKRSEANNIYQIEAFPKLQDLKKKVYRTWLFIFYVHESAVTATTYLNMQSGKLLIFIKNEGVNQCNSQGRMEPISANF